MLEADWQSAVASLAAKPLIHVADPIGMARTLLFECYSLACEAPQDVQQRFAAERKLTIEELARAIQERLLRSEFSLKLPSQSGVDDTFTALCAYVRALDEYLNLTRGDFGSRSDAADLWLVEMAGKRGYLIPSTTARNATAAPGGKRHVGAFLTRLMEWHRILPDRVGDYEVNPVSVDVSIGPLAEIVLGAGLFADLDLDVSAHCTADRFRVGGVICNDVGGVIDAHLARAHLEGCAFVAFPELTIDAAQRERVGRELKRRPWRRSGAADRTVPLLLVGSWHEQEGGAWFNVATILDGYGDVVARHRKLFPYLDKDGRLEDISCGKRVTVIVAEDALIAVGICRDFCERGGPKANPYSQLDVDLFAIASFGDEKTMEGHIATANDVAIKFHAHSFVVQQAEKTCSAIGFVIPTGEPGPLKVDAVARNNAWNSVKIAGQG